jgi:hypothetical protein
MGDAYGMLPLPALAPAADEALTDPAIDILLEFMTAVLNYYGDAAWASVSGYQAGDNHTVVQTFNFDPHETTFNTRDLPALFLWRKKIGGSAWLATDYYVRESKLILQWVPPPAIQSMRARWRPFINLIASALDGIMDPSARVPSWIYPGDTDPIAQYDGSLLWKYMPLTYEFDIGDTTTVPITIEMVDGSNKENYWAIQVEIKLREQSDTDTPELHAFRIKTAIVTEIDNQGLEIIPQVTLSLTPTKIFPTSGLIDSGTVVTIFGVGFGDNPVITFGDDDGTVTKVADHAVITGLTPHESTGGVVDVTITNENGDSSTLPAAFTFF